MPEYPQVPQTDRYPWPMDISPPAQPPMLLDEVTPAAQLLHGHQHSWRIDGTCTSCAWTVKGCIARAKAEKESI